MFETEKEYIVHFLAEDYDVDIDHELDSIRFHRSRVNLVTKVEPIGIDGVIWLRTNELPEVYTPFNIEEACVSFENGVCCVRLPDKCAYAIMKIPKACK